MEYLGTETVLGEAPDAVRAAGEEPFLRVQPEPFRGSRLLDRLRPPCAQVRGKDHTASQVAIGAQVARGKEIGELGPGKARRVLGFQAQMYPRVG